MLKLEGGPPKLPVGTGKFPWTHLLLPNYESRDSSERSKWGKDEEAEQQKGEKNNRNDATTRHFYRLKKYPSRDGAVKHVAPRIEG